MSTYRIDLKHDPTEVARDLSEVHVNFIHANFTRRQNLCIPLEIIYVNLVSQKT
ncbi:hypothetical protein X942_5964 [Burkholderia pseudomallei MSHR5596]|nr:hypothetical protein X942_5964 [Burkholderia pseudomallei MSHR5596]